ncbi:hypothetical protein TWF730_011162 [Orbilia blumenaviensis]|uniref:F-box domain-containing protein n=1 Tax=Orbilia blumenaviensis TaxID=1796055 RepID=A0AAV9UJT0_9PEZI
MYLPPEIILTILDQLDCTPGSPENDRATVVALRSVSKDFYAIVTPILFRNFSLHYGVSRSIPQMQAITSAPMIQPYIRSLFIPSESFFPLGKNVQFNTKDHFPWSRGPALTWLAINDYSQSAPVCKGLKGRRSHTKQTLMLHYPFREYPTKPWKLFTLRQKEFRLQEQEYSAVLSNFIDACGNLEDIHIAIGLGGETGRMSAFGKILEKHLIPKILAKGLRRMTISAPSGYGVALPFLGSADALHGASRTLPDLSSLRSFTIQTCYGAAAGAMSREFKAFFQALTGLTSFSLSMSSPLRAQSTDMIFGHPASAISQNLTRVELCSIFLWKNVDNFRDFLSQVPTITELILTHIVLPIASHGPEGYTCPSENWWTMFQHILTTLPKLQTCTFKHLMYGDISDHVWWGPQYVLLLLPSTFDGEKSISYSWRTNLGGSELISPFDEDWKGLQLLKRVVGDRGTENQSDGEIHTHTEDGIIPEWAIEKSDWIYLADK